MQANEEQRPSDTIRIFLFIIMISMLLSPDKGSNSSNLRDEDAEQRMKREEQALTNQLEFDIDKMQKVASNYAFNISGIFSGRWKRNENPISFRPSNISMGLFMDVQRKEGTSRLKGQEGILNLQLFDRGIFKKDIHQISGAMTMIEGEQDSKDDAMSLNLLGLYFIPSGHLTLFADVRGYRYSLLWDSEDETNLFNVTNEFSTTIGRKMNDSNILFLSRSNPFIEPSDRCLYRFDVDLLSLQQGVDPEISHNVHSRVLLNATGGLLSPNCNTNVTLSFDGFSMDTNHITTKSRIYTGITIFISLGESFLYIEHMKQFLFSSAIPASLLMYIFLSAIDLLLAMLHSLASIFFLGLFSEFYLISFHKLFMFSVVEMRIIFIIWKSRYPDINNANYMQYQRKLSAIFFGLYILIIGTLISVYSGHMLGYVLIAVIYSFWIIRSLQTGQRPPFSLTYVIATSLFKLFLPLYILACPYNIITMFSEWQIPKRFGWWLVGWIILQTCIVLVQILNPYLILPRFLRPKKYDYHVIPNTDEPLIVDCAICMCGIDYDEKETYMITPCSHAFHADCLQKWMEVKLECPTCRGNLPDVRYL